MTARLIVHCDWSTSDKKRWACRAIWERECFHIAAPEPVGRLESFFSDLRAQESRYGIFAGFDFPIGIPRAYADRAGISRFADSLITFGENECADFYKPAEKAS
jgi:hypothetical protein